MNILIPFAAVPLAQVPSVGFNNNFTEIANKFNTYAVQTDVARTISVAHTWAVSQNWSVAQTFSADLLFTDALYDIGKSGLTRPRDIFSSRNMVAGNNIFIDNDAAAFRLRTTAGVEKGTWQLSGSDIVWSVGGIERARMLSTGQFLIGTTTATDVGATGMRAEGASVFGDVLRVKGASIYLDFDSGAFRFRTTAGVEKATVRLSGNDLFFETGGTEVVRFNAAGAIKMSTAVSKIIAGATSVAFRNSADSADNVLITDAGNVTVRASLNAASGTFSGSASNGAVNLTPVASDPFSPANGDLWARTSGEFRARLNGVTKVVQSAAQKVIGDQIAGWNAPTGTQTRGTFDAAATLAVTAQTLVALIADLRTHGLIFT